MPLRPKRRWLEVFFNRGESASSSRLQLFINWGCVVFLSGTLSGFIFWKSSLHWDWPSVAKYRSLFWIGWRTTLAISVCSLTLSTAIGSIVALAQRSQFLPLRFLSKAYVEVIRGTPLLAQIYIFFYIIAETIHLQDRLLAGTLALSLFSGAYISEIIRSGIESVGASQLESAKAIGLTISQTYRHVVLPQALRAILPPLSGQFVSLIKDSSLLSIIGLNELTQNAKNVASYTFSNFESYLILAAGYLALTLPISLWTRWLEKRFRYET